MQITTGQTERFFQEIKGKKVLVVGDVMIDTYLWGNVERISPESPVPVVDVKKTEHRLGGAGNVALNVRSLGAEVVLCSVTGDDPESTILEDLLQENKVDAGGIVKSPAKTTTVKTRILCRNHQMLRFDKEQANDLTHDEGAFFLDKIKGHLDSEIDLVIFQDYNKGVLTPFVISSVNSECRKRGILTAVDPKKKNFFEYQQVDLFKPNLREVYAALNIDPPQVSLESLNHITGVLSKKLQQRQTLITLSEEGVYFNNGRGGKVLPAHKRDVSDVSGAGDTVISVAALALSCGLELELAAWLANIAAGIVCEEPGVVPIHLEELEQAVKQELNLTSA